MDIRRVWTKPLVMIASYLHLFLLFSYFPFFLFHQKNPAFLLSISSLRGFRYNLTVCENKTITSLAEGKARVRSFVILNLPTLLENAFTLN